ncbi:transglutaminase [Bifidobacterium avesanii]|nr:transglutaminase [Bifidobacterium avesanii]
MTGDANISGPIRLLQDRPGSVISQPSTGAKIAASTAMPAAILALTLTAVSPLIPVYGSPGVWLLGALPAAALGCVIAAGLRAHGILQILALMAAQFAVGPAVAALPGLVCAHGDVTAMSAALREGWHGVFGAFKLLVVLQPPVGATAGSLMAVWTLGLFAAFGGTFAASAIPAGRVLPRGLGMIVPQTLAHGCAALMGTHDGWHAAAVGAVFAVVFLSTIGVAGAHAAVRHFRLPGAAAMMAVAMAIALAVAPAVPQRRLTLRDRYSPPAVAQPMGSPLSGMRGLLRRHRDDPLVTVTGLPSGTPVRLAVMDDFDGVVWNLSSGDFRRSGGVIATDDSAGNTDNAGNTGDAGANSAAAGTPFTATFTVHGALGDHWLPVSGAARRVVFADPSHASALYANDDGTLMLTDELCEGLAYTVGGVVPRRPGAAELERAEAGAIAQPAARDAPESAGRFARAIAGGASGAGAAAEALASSLRRTGWFSHGLDDDYPSPPGHGSHRIQMLLAGDAMVGDGEQYASAMALMARELGLPSRVVLGFRDGTTDSDATGGDATGGNADAEADGTTVTFTGNDVTAWTEVNLDGYGWVAFDPTPPESKTPDDTQQLAPPDPRTLVRQPPVPLTDPLREETRPNGQSAVTGDDAAPPGDATPPWLASAGRIAAVVTLVGSPVWALAAGTGLILVIKALLLARARRHGTPRRRIHAGWRAICSLAAHCGTRVPWHGTAPAQAQAIADALRIDARGLTALARQADHAAFSGERVSDRTARRYWRAVDRSRHAMLRSLPRTKRWRAQLAIVPGRRPVKSGKERTANAKGRPTGARCVHVGHARRAPANRPRHQTLSARRPLAWERSIRRSDRRSRRRGRSYPSRRHRRRRRCPNRRRSRSRGPRRPAWSGHPGR